MFDKLPKYCAAKNPSTGEPILIRRGDNGFYRWWDGAPFDPEERAEMVDEIIDNFNRARNVTVQQREAMIAGSMFGWDVPAADPDQYDSEGNLRRVQRARRPDFEFVASMYDDKATASNYGKYGINLRDNRLDCDDECLDHTHLIHVYRFPALRDYIVKLLDENPPSADVFATRDNVD